MSYLAKLKKRMGESTPETTETAAHTFTQPATGSFEGFEGSGVSAYSESRHYMGFEGCGGSQDSTLSENASLVGADIQKTAGRDPPPQLPKPRRCLYCEWWRQKPDSCWWICVCGKYWHDCGIKNYCKEVPP